MTITLTASHLQHQPSGAYVTKEVEPHLKKHHKGIKAATRREIAQQVKDLPGMIEDQRGLLTWQKPPPTKPP
jgi:hypothetical protein